MLNIASLGRGSARMSYGLNAARAQIGAVALEAGWPVCAKPGRTDGISLFVPQPPLLAGFAGILTERIEYKPALGDQTSVLAVEGIVQANVYRPTAAQIASGPFVAPTVGVHLAPYYAGNEAYLIPVSLNTGIRLMEDKTLAVEGAVLRKAEGTAPYVEILPGAVNGEIRRAFWPGALAASTTYILAAFATSASALTTKVQADMANIAPDMPRNLTVTVAATTAAHIKAVTITITGLDMAGEVISEGFATTDDTANTITGAKIFSAVTDVAVPAQDGASVTVAVGIGAKLGLPEMMSRAPVLLQARVDSTAEGTPPTFTFDADVLSGNGVTFNTAPNGSRIHELWYTV